MKKSLLSVAFLSAVLIASCGNKTETVEATDAQEVATAGAETYKATAESVITWKGGKKYEDINKPEDGHNGIVKLQSAELGFENGALVSGTFVADFATFESKDLDGDLETKGKLDGHLKSADFLDVEKFPTAKFEITTVETIAEEGYNTKISGNLDFRGTPKNISFKANVTNDGTVASIVSEEFAINRKEFGIVFETPAGSIIKDEILLKVDIKAAK